MRGIIWNSYVELVKVYYTVFNISKKAVYGFYNKAGQEEMPKQSLLYRNSPLWVLIVVRFLESSAN